MNFKKEKSMIFLLFTGFILSNCIVDASSTVPSPSLTPIFSDVSSFTGDWIEKTNTPEAGGYGEALIGTDYHIYVVRCMYASSTPYFWRYNPSTDNWDSMSISGLPIGAFRNGAALTWDYDNYIYALLGGRYSDSNRTLFYRYNILNNDWEKLADTPHAQGAGDALTFSGNDNNIYAITGSSKHGTAFTCYNLSDNSWSILTFNPEWTGTDDGASLVWTGGEYLYALQGEWQETNPNQEFARFHTLTKTWDDMTSIPESEGIADGASLLWVEDYPDYIFALGGGSCLENPGYNFYYYNISQDSWDELESIPCPIGYYTGNRLGFTVEYIYYWQGAPTTWDCNGDAFYKLKYNPPNISIDPVISPTTINSQTITGTRGNGVNITVICQTATIGLINYPTDTTWSVEITDLTQGENIITITVTDLAGNTATVNVSIEYNTGNETVSIGSVTVDVNDIVMLPISIANASNIQQVALDIDFNPNVVSILNVTANDVIPSSTITYTSETGKVAIELSNLDNITVTDTTLLIDITFQTEENTGMTTLELRNIELTDNTGSHAPYEIINGSITVCIKGDFNYNNRVDIGDAAKVAFMVAGKVSEDPRADFNNNGRVDVGDAAKISFYLAGKVSEL